MPRTYQLAQANIDKVSAIAVELETYPSQVVNMLLTRALAEIEAGRWHFGRQPLVYRPFWSDHAANTPQE